MCRLIDIVNKVKIFKRDVFLYVKKMKKKKSEKSLKNFFKGKDILITGGCGSIGSEIVKQLLSYYPKRVRILDNNESAQFFLSRKLNSNKIRHLIGDIRDPNRVNRAMEGVDIVFHAAALKHVPLCEYNPFEAVNTNVIGTQNLIEAARKYNVKTFMSISTDKAVNPINTMGATKLLSEKIVITAPLGDCKTKFSCVRFGNVLNSSGSVIPIFKKQIIQGGPVTITSDDMTRFFMSIWEAVNLVLKSVAMMEGGEIFILKMNSLKILALAETMIEEMASDYGYNPKKILVKSIGVRPGEKISECLITKEETSFIEEKKDVFIIRPPMITPQFKKEFISKRHYNEYDSDNIPQLSKSKIRKLLYHYEILSK